MTREEELALLIEEQRKDDTTRIWPEHFVALSLDAAVSMDDGDVFTLGSFVGVDEDGEIVSYLRPRGPFFRPMNENESWHGTMGGYTNYRCRCPRCRQANTDHCRAYRRRKRAESGEFDRKKRAYDAKWRLRKRQEVAA